MLNIWTMLTSNTTQCTHSLVTWLMLPELMPIILLILMVDFSETTSLEMRSSLDKWTIVEPVSQLFGLTTSMTSKSSEEEIPCTTTSLETKLQLVLTMKLDKTCSNTEEELQEEKLPPEFLTLTTITSSNCATNGSTMLSHPGLTGDQLRQFPVLVHTSISKSIL